MHAEQHNTQASLVPVTSSESSIMSSFTVLLLALSFTLGQATLMPPLAGSCSVMNYTKIPFCYTAGYSKAAYPTANGIENEEQAQMQLNDFRLVVLSNCSGASLLFLCSYYAPPCFLHIDRLFRLNPCRELCEAYYDGCYQNYVNRSISWPAHLNCNLFPNRSDHAICFSAEDPSSLVLPAVMPGINAPIPIEVPTSSHPPLQSTPLPSVLLSVDPADISSSSSFIGSSSSGTILSTASSSVSSSSTPTRPSSTSTPTLMASPGSTSFSESPALHCCPLLIAVLLIVLCLTLLVD